MPAPFFSIRDIDDLKKYNESHPLKKGSIDEFQGEICRTGHVHGFLERYYLNHRPLNSMTTKVLDQAIVSEMLKETLFHRDDAKFAKRAEALTSYCCLNGLDGEAYALAQELDLIPTKSEFKIEQRVDISVLPDKPDLYVHRGDFQLWQHGQLTAQVRLTTHLTFDGVKFSVKREKATVVERQEGALLPAAISIEDKADLALAYLCQVHRLLDDYRCYLEQIYDKTYGQIDMNAAQHGIAERKLINISLMMECLDYMQPVQSMDALRSMLDDVVHRTALCAYEFKEEATLWKKLIACILRFFVHLGFIKSQGEKLVNQLEPVLKQYSQQKTVPPHVTR